MRAANPPVLFTRWGAIATYMEYLRISLQTMLAYRARYYVGVITYVIHVAVYYYIYQALFAHGGEIKGYALEQMLTYVAVGWACKSFYLNYIDRDMADEVRSGHIAMDMIKPINLQWVMVARGLGQGLFRLVLFTPPVVLATALLFKVQLPISATAGGLFLVSTLLSAVIYLGINFLVGLTAIYFLSISQILYSKNLMIELFSGLLIPISWFPAWFQTLSSWLPFQAIAYVPLEIYLGRLAGAAAVEALVIQLVWSVVLTVIGWAWWRLCQRKLLIQGG
jgi:ABC-2 type transport system permease protein